VKSEKNEELRVKSEELRGNKKIRAKSGKKEK
jgi:hypothetical protein